MVRCIKQWMMLLLLLLLWLCSLSNALNHVKRTRERERRHRMREGDTYSKVKLLDEGVVTELVGELSCLCVSDGLLLFVARGESIDGRRPHARERERDFGMVRT